MSSHRTLILGLSGPSSSGKTTVARFLRSIFNIEASKETNGRSISLFILHQDDFYKSDEQIPMITTHSRTHGTRELQDWDCAESLDLPLLESTLEHITTHGALPADMHSKEDQNAIGNSGIADPNAAVASHREGLQQWLRRIPTESVFPQSLTLCVLDGFLLYPDPQPSSPGSSPSVPRGVTSQLAVRLFLRSTFARTKARREARAGYVTLEGFWADPPGYVDDVVWPNYVREHAWMFQGGDVDDGEVLTDKLRECYGDGGIEVGPGKGERGMEDILAWAVTVVTKKMQMILSEDDGKRVM